MPVLPALECRGKRACLAIVVTDPRGEVYYGGQVAGPVFAKVMDGALRYRNIPPDAIEKSIEENSTTTSSRKTANNVKKEVRG